MKYDFYQKIREDLILAIQANGGQKFREEWCQCEPEVGYYPCEYCAIFHALDNFRRLLNINIDEPPVSKISEKKRISVKDIIDNITKEEGVNPITAEIDKIILEDIKLAREGKLKNRNRLSRIE